MNCSNSKSAIGTQTEVWLITPNMLLNNIQSLGVLVMTNIENKQTLKSRFFVSSHLWRMFSKKTFSRNATICTSYSASNYRRTYKPNGQPESRTDAPKFAPHQTKVKSPRNNGPSVFTVCVFFRWTRLGCVLSCLLPFMLNRVCEFVVSTDFGFESNVMPWLVNAIIWIFDPFKQHYKLSNMSSHIYVMH